MKNEQTTDALEILYRKFYRGHPLRILGLWWARVEARIDRVFYRIVMYIMERRGWC